MTKRFELIECNGNIEDGCTQNVYDGGEDVFELLDLLNSLNDKNEQLKSICQDHRDHAIDFKADCVRLEKENEQLKRQVGNLEHTRDFCADVCADCERLEKENKELKQKIERFENYKEASDKFTKEVEDFFERHEIDAINFGLIDTVFDGFEFYSDKYNELKKENKELKKENEQLKEHQKTLEAKIVRLKDRVKTFEKHYSLKDIERYKKMENCNCITAKRLEE